MLETFKSRFVLNFITDDRWKYILDGLGVTLKVTLFAGIVGILIGFLIAAVRSTYDKTGKLKLLNLVCNFYLTVIRAGCGTAFDYLFRCIWFG